MYFSSDMGRLFMIFSICIGFWSDQGAAGSANLTLQCTGLHEVPACLHPCPPERRCDNRHYALPCTPPTGPCTPTCVCADGYARNPEGTCITFAQCDKCMPDNTQYFACDGDYDENCPGACYCSPGYVQGANNTCVSTKTSDNTIYLPPPNPPVLIKPQPPQNIPTRPIKNPRGVYCNCKQKPIYQKPSGPSVRTQDGHAIPLESIRPSDSVPNQPIDDGPSGPIESVPGQPSVPKKPIADAPIWGVRPIPPSIRRLPPQTVAVSKAKSLEPVGPINSVPNKPIDDGPSDQNKLIPSGPVESVPGQPIDYIVPGVPNKPIANAPIWGVRPIPPSIRHLPPQPVAVSNAKSLEPVGPINSVPNQPIDDGPSNPNKPIADGPSGPVESVPGQPSVPNKPIADAPIWGVKPIPPSIRRLPPQPVPISLEPVGPINSGPNKPKDDGPSDPSKPINDGPSGPVESVPGQPSVPNKPIRGVHPIPPTIRRLPLQSVPAWLYYFKKSPLCH